MLDSPIYYFGILIAKRYSLAIYCLINYGCKLAKGYTDMTNKSQVTILSLLLIYANHIRTMEHADATGETSKATYKKALSDSRKFQSTAIASYKQAITILAGETRPEENIRTAQIIVSAIPHDHGLALEERCVNKVSKLRSTGLITALQYLADRDTVKAQHLEMHRVHGAYAMLLEQNQIQAERRAVAAGKIQVIVRKKVTQKAAAKAE